MAIGSGVVLVGAVAGAQSVLPDGGVGGGVGDGDPPDLLLLLPPPMSVMEPRKEDGE
jgi:hypothetical protein